MHGTTFIEVLSNTKQVMTNELISPDTLKLAMCHPKCGTRPSGNSGNWADYKAKYNPSEMSFKSGCKYS